MKREAQARQRAKDLVKYRLDNRREWLGRQYGMTVADYDALLAQQGGACAICHVDLEPGRRAHVDHDHDSGRVRGILCRRCNRALGLFRDDAELCRSAAAYLTRSAFRWSGENRDVAPHRTSQPVDDRQVAP